MARAWPAPPTRQKNFTRPEIVETIKTLPDVNDF
jgi:hypothetical protein